MSKMANIGMHSGKILKNAEKIMHTTYMGSGGLRDFSKQYGTLLNNITILFDSDISYPDNHCLFLVIVYSLISSWSVLKQNLLYFILEW